MIRRRGFFALAAAGFLAGCNKVRSQPWFADLMQGVQGWHRGLHRNLGMGRITMAPEFGPDEISPFFRGNGSLTVDTDAYRLAEAQGFANWRLEVGGLVAAPFALGLEEIRALPQRTQITRHDCVEGWSAIGQWTGPQLATILDRARLLPAARFIVFHCADTLNGKPYYESCDIEDALHPQTIIAHQLNGAPLPVINGAPLRLRIERQLGYKQAKFLTGIEAVASLDGIGRGKGGYWEDVANYQWYAGI